MYKKSITIIALTLLSVLSFAQQHKSKQATIVVGKVLSAEDSVLVKQFFFDGLHEKVIQNIPLATDYFKRVINIDPANDAAMYELATIYNTQNNIEEAAELMQKATTISPDNIWYWTLLEDIYAKTDNAAQLELVYNELIRLDPETQEYYLAKAAVLISQNKLDEADLVYQEVQKHFGPSDELTKVRQQIYFQKGKSAQAIAELEKLIRDNPQNVNNYVYLADIYTQLGDREKAVAVLEKGKGVDPQNTLIHLSLADNYRALNRFDDAFVELKVAFQSEDLSLDEKIRVIVSFFPLFADEKARAFADELAAILVHTYPHDPKSYATYGDVLFQEQKYTEALQSYKSALKLNNQIYEAWEQVVRIEVGNDDFQQAIIDGDEALAFFPNQAVLYLFTGMAYARDQKHEKTITYLKNAISLGSDDDQVLDQIYSTLGDSYNALKRYKESDEAYEKALEINPANSYTLNNYAYYLSLRGVKLEKAAQMAQYATTLDPNNASSEDTYAWILFKQKKYDDARIWIEKAITDDKSNSAVQFEHYGDILYFLGDKKQAVEQWKKARSLGDKSNQLEKKINEKKYVE